MKEVLLIAFNGVNPTSGKGKVDKTEPSAKLKLYFNWISNPEHPNSFTYCVFSDYKFVRKDKFLSFNGMQSDYRVVLDDVQVDVFNSNDAKLLVKNHLKNYESFVTDHNIPPELWPEAIFDQRTHEIDVSQTLEPIIKSECKLKHPRLILKEK